MLAAREGYEDVFSLSVDAYEAKGPSHDLLEDACLSAQNVATRGSLESASRKGSMSEQRLILAALLYNMPLLER